MEGGGEVGVGEKWKEGRRCKFLINKYIKKKSYFSYTRARKIIFKLTLLKIILSLGSFN